MITEGKSGFYWKGIFGGKFDPYIVSAEKKKCEKKHEKGGVFLRGLLE